MRDASKNGAHIPCKPDCTGRSPECHGACQAYKEYRARMDEIRAERLKAAEADQSTTRERAIRRNLKNQMQGRRTT